MFIKKTRHPFAVYPENEYFEKFKDGKFYNLNEIAEMLGYKSSYSLYRYISKREIPVLMAINKKTNRFFYKIHEEYLPCFDRYHFKDINKVPNITTKEVATKESLDRMSNHFLKILESFETVIKDYKRVLNEKK